jgi:hypothetical protein
VLFVISGTIPSVYQSGRDAGQLWSAPGTDVELHHVMLLWRISRSYVAILTQNQAQFLRRIKKVWLLALTPISTSEEYAKMIQPILVIFGFTGLAFLTVVPSPWRPMLAVAGIAVLAFVAAYRLQKELDQQQSNLPIRIVPDWSDCTALA